MASSSLHTRFAIRTVLRVYVAVCGATAFMATPTLAQQSSPRIEVFHRSPDLKELPTGRPWVPIVVELRNTREIDLKVRLVGSRDGRFMDVTLPKGALNPADVPTYQMEVPAPSAAMTYQFVIHQPDGSLTTSKRFTMQRPCVQNYKVEVPESDPNGTFKRKVAIIVAQAGSLERDLGHLDAAVKILEEIRTNIPN